MQFLYRIHAYLRQTFGRRTVTIGAVALGAIFVILAAKLFTGTIEPMENTPIVKTVHVATVAELTGGTSAIATVGTVEAVNEARLMTERGGRITSVPVSLGSRVGVGTVIATIENSAESAAVLQAQGVYDAARAAAATSDVGSASADRAYEEAGVQAANVYRDALSTSDNVLRNTVNDVFSLPENGIPGVRIDSNNRAALLIAERETIEQMLNVWSQKVTSGNGANENLVSEAERIVTRFANFVLTLSSLLAEEDALSNETELATLRTDFATARATLNGTLQTLSSARNNLSNAKAAQEQAAIAGSDGDVSIAEAQVTQALGALRLAQANLAKTIIRSPITGTVSALNLKVGSTVSVGAPAAVISSSGGFEIVTYVNEKDAARIRVGADVQIESDAAGIVTEIASAIDSLTRKIEVRIGVQSGTDLLNGETVSVKIETDDTSSNSSVGLFLPVVAIKMTPQGPVVFSVRDDNTLMAHQVTLGAISGDQIGVEGIDELLTIVTDARGLRAEETVLVSTP